MNTPLSSEKRFFLKVRPKEGGPWCTIEPCELLSTLDADTDNIYEIQLVRMTDEQWEKLPEFEGW